MLSSCGTYTGQGAVAGGAFGSVLGSAIGGIAGGWRGHDIGTIVGMAGGAVVGAAVGAAADQQAQRSYEPYGDDNHYSDCRHVDRHDKDYDRSVDDRIDFDAPGPRRATLEIRNARFVDADHDGVIRRGEECKISFEIMNRTQTTVYDIRPSVYDATANKHIQISPNLRIESIAPNSGVRYTASVLADRKLKDGKAVICVSVAHGSQELASEVKEFVVQTRKK